MRTFNRFATVLLIAVLYAIAGFSQCDIVTDRDATLTVWGYCWWSWFLYVGDQYEEIGNSQDHPLVYSWRYWWFRGKGSFTRSYLHFDRDEVPECFAKAYLRLYFSEPPSPSQDVSVYGVPWDGTPFTWVSRPLPERFIGSLRVSGAGWVEIDVTDWVRDAVSDPRGEVGFMLRLSEDTPCPGYNKNGKVYFTKPCLRFEPCIKLEVEDNLKDFTVTQAFIGDNRYAELGTFKVTVGALVPYEVRACYDVSPEPDPVFSADPMDVAYTWVWFTLPRCRPDGSSYIVLPCFSGTPGTETCTFRARVDLADLGDRETGEVFSFSVIVWAVPR